MGNCCQAGPTVEAQTTGRRRRSSSKSDSKDNNLLFKKYTKSSDYRKKYEYISVIGSGAFGKVRLFVDKKSRNLRYAIKTIKKDIFNKNSIDSINREIEILRTVDHPNIVKYFETYEDEKYLHIVMEYIPGDNLFKLLTNQSYFKFTEREISQIMTCLLKAVAFLHHNGIIHRDIKPENIVFIEPGNFNALKLIDFGLSISRNAKSERRRVGTPYYMSPEMINGQFFPVSDVWSLGVILFIMVTGRQPFAGKDREEVFEKVKEGAFDTKTLRRAKCSGEVKDLIKKMLVVDTKKRVGVEECLEHQWFKLFDDEKSKNLAVDKEIIESLKEFQYRNLFQKEILYYLAKLSDDRDLVKLKDAFLAIDKDNSGEIEYEEIPKIFNELGIEASDKELKDIFSGMDFHCDGKVNYSEFLAATISSINFNKEENLWSAFKYFDSNDTGYITLDSAIAALKASNVVVDEKGLKETFKNLHNNKKIDFEEFKKIAFKSSEMQHLEASTNV